MATPSAFGTTMGPWWGGVCHCCTQILDQLFISKVVKSIGKYLIIKISQFYFIICALVPDLGQISSTLNIGTNGWPGTCISSTPWISKDTKQPQCHLITTFRRIGKNPLSPISLPSQPCEVSTFLILLGWKEDQCHAKKPYFHASFNNLVNMLIDQEMSESKCQMKLPDRCFILTRELQHFLLSSTRTSCNLAHNPYPTMSPISPIPSIQASHQA